MGEELKRADNKLNGQLEGTAGGKAGGRSGGSAGTADTGTGGRGTGGRTAGDTAKEKLPKKADGLPVITDVTSGEAVKTAEKEPPKKKAPKKITRKKKSGETSKQISGVIQSMSLLIASRPEKAHWAISEEEADSIAEPLANILESSEALAKISEHSDGLALAFAAAMVIIPRAMVEVELQKQKPKKKHVRKEVAPHVELNQSGNDDRSNENGKSAQRNKSDDTSAAALYKTDGYGLSAVLPSIM